MVIDTFAIDQENDVFSKCFVHAAIDGEDLDDLVGQMP